MPPVEFDTIPRIPSYNVDNIKDSIASCNDVLDLGTFEPIITRSRGFISGECGAIEDVKVPEVSTLVIEDVPVVNAADYTFGKLAVIASNVTDNLVAYSLVQTGLKTLDYGFEFSEKVMSNLSSPFTKHVQSMRRHLRAVRYAGRRHARKGTVPSSSRRRSLRILPSRKSFKMRESSLFGYFIEILRINWFLSFFGISITLVSDPLVKSERKNDFDDQDWSDDETTVYKLMKEYDSQDDVDYILSDSSMDSMEFHSDFSEDETTVDKLTKDYSDIEDCDYVPSDASEDSLEYNSDEGSEDTEDLDYEGSDSEDLSEDETTVGMIMKDYSEESAEDDDYIPCEETEDGLEYDSDASLSVDTESNISEDDEDPEEESQEDEMCGTPACGKMDEISQDSQEVENN